MAAVNRRGKVIAISTAAVGVACVFAVWRALTPRADPYAGPELTLPPALVSPQELGGRRPLFDSQTTRGWQIEGPHRIQEGTLELGGAEATRAVTKHSLVEGEYVEFDFFQEGPAEAKLWVKPTLIAPLPPDPEFRRDIPFNLNLSGFLYRRWHTVRVHAGQEGTNATVTIDIQAQHEGPGRGGGANHSLPARGGCRHELVFEVAPGSKLHLRNVLVGGPMRRE